MGWAVLLFRTDFPRFVVPGTVSVQHEVDRHELLPEGADLVRGQGSGLPYVDGVPSPAFQHDLQGDPSLVPHEAGSRELYRQVPVLELGLLYVSPAQGGFLLLAEELLVSEVDMVLGDLDLSFSVSRFSIFADLGLGCVLFGEVLEAFLEVEGP